ncbi:ANTAR domain-containing protein [Streptomyces nigra]
MTSAAGVPAPPSTVPIHQLAPAVGFEVLREVSQHTHTKLQTVAETVIA